MAVFDFFLSKKGFVEEHSRFPQMFGIKMYQNFNLNNTDCKLCPPLTAFVKPLYLP